MLRGPDSSLDLRVLTTNSRVLQEHDTGSLTINGVTYAVVNAEKVGPAVLHFLDKPLPVKKVRSSRVRYPCGARVFWC